MEKGGRDGCYGIFLVCLARGAWARALAARGSYYVIYVLWGGCSKAITSTREVEYKTREKTR